MKAVMRRQESSQGMSRQERAETAKYCANLFHCHRYRRQCALACVPDLGAQALDYWSQGP